jgi:hypothetical protein
MRQSTDAGPTFKARLTFAFINLPDFSKRLAVRKPIRILEIEAPGGIA